MKNKLITDLIREILKSPGRFLSIFFIVFLGTAFFSGLRSSGLDMKLSADAYYDDTKLMDAKVLSTLGLTDKEIFILKETEGLHSIEAVKTKEVLLNTASKSYLTKLIQYTENINIPYLLQGKLPRKMDEVLMDEALFTQGNYKIGDRLFFESADNKDLGEDLNIKEAIITGVCHLPYFLETERGTSSLSGCSVDAFLVLPKEAFRSEVYSEAVLRFQSAEALLTYSKDYKNKVSPILSDLEHLKKRLAESRYQTIVSEGETKIKENEEKIIDGEKKLFNARKELSEGEEKLAKERLKLDEEKKKLKAARLLSLFLPKLKEAEKRLKTEEKKLKAAKTEFEKKEEKELQKIQDAKEKLEKARKELRELEFPEIYILGRDKFPSYVSFEQNANRMDNIGNIFPVIFFLVAALVSLTAMTRMVDEGRIMMGTLKALGFSNTKIIGKYLLYSLFATFTGSLIGVFAGERYFPFIIISSYQILFVAMPYILTPLNFQEGFLALFFALLSTGGATIVSSYHALKETPASLMRPLPPKHGKRVLMERLPFVWKHLSFTRKSTIRNLARYKKRLFMTVFGIGSCMGLLLVGFGLEDSIQEIAKNQYITIFPYDARLILDDKADSTKKEELYNLVSSHSEIKHQKYICFQTIDAKSEVSSHQSYLFSPKDGEKLSEYVILRDAKTKENLPFPKKGVYITEKLARMLNLEVGETMRLSKEGEKDVFSVIEGIVENYMFHFVFMSPETYESLFDKPPIYNNLFLSYSDGEIIEAELGEKFLSSEAVTGMSYVSDLKEQIDSMLKVLNLVILVLISSAGLLAFVVLYNLNSINIMERKRELATLKVLGFYDGEVSSYIYRENIILTVFGVVLGSVFGTILHRFVIQTVETDIMMFGKTIHPHSYFLSILLTFLFSIFVNFIMHFVLKRIDMTQSLKSVE